MLLGDWNSTMGGPRSRAFWTGSWILPLDAGRGAAGKLELSPAASLSEVMTALYDKHRAVLPSDASALQLAFQVRAIRAPSGFRLCLQTSALLALQADRAKVVTRH